MSSKFTLSAVPALLAALSLTAMPAEAAELPVAVSHTAIDVAPAWSPGEDTAANHRRYRYRRNRVDVGDVLTGVLIVGGIAAIANAATRERYRDRNGDWRYRDNRYPDARYPDARYPDNRDYRSGDYGDEESRGLDSAARQCVDAVERDQRVQRVDNVERDGNGWRVTGSLYNGAGFSCSIGADGRIQGIDMGGQSESYRSGPNRSDEAQPYEEGSSDDRQWGDDRYSEERARIEDQSASNTSVPPPYDYRESQDTDEPEYGEPAQGDFEVGTGYSGSD